MNSIFRPLVLATRNVLTSSSKANIYILVVFLVRTGYGLFIVDPHSGQDAPSYYEDSQIVLREGPFAQVTYAPIWPIGYTWFISLIWKIGGVDSRLLGVTQSVLVFFATLALYHLVKREINERVAIVASILMSSSFAIFVSAGEIMYETPMMAFFLFGLNLLSRFSLSEVESKKTLIAAGVWLGLSILIHPSMLGPVVITFLAISLRCLKTKRVSITFLVLVLLVIAMGPGVNTLRNYVSGDGLGYTGNIYTISTFSGWGANNPEELAKCKVKGVRITNLAFSRKREFYDSTSRQICLYRVALQTPVATSEIVIRNGIRWVSPYVGVLKSNGTWYHGLDIRRLTPQYIWWDGQGRIIDTMLGSVWIISHLSLMMFGCYLILRKKSQIKLRDRYSPYIFVLPVLVKWATSMFTHGDSRHRLGISPLYLTLLAISLCALIARIQVKNSRS